VFKLIPFDHQVWHGMLIYKPDQVQDLAKTYEKYLKSQNDPKAVAAIIMGCLPPTFDPVLTLIAYYEGSEEDGKRIFQPFFDIKPVVNRTSTKTFYELVPFSDILRFTYRTLLWMPWLTHLEGDT